jgi:serine/threonine-protein kinase HipA
MTLTPAYDLLNVSIADPNDNEEFALTLDGKKGKLKLEHFTQFGLGLGLNDRQIRNTFKRFQNKKDIAFKWLDNSFLSDEYKQSYKDVMNHRYSILKM